jgi:hypothetical protein
MATEKSSAGGAGAPTVPTPTEKPKPIPLISDVALDNPVSENVKSYKRGEPSLCVSVWVGE